MSLEAIIGTNCQVHLARESVHLTLSLGISKAAKLLATYPGFERLFHYILNLIPDSSRRNFLMSIFQIRYFENGALEPGYWQHCLNKLMHVKN